MKLSDKQISYRQFHLYQRHKNHGNEAVFSDSLIASWCQMTRSELQDVRENYEKYLALYGETVPERKTYTFTPCSPECKIA